MSWYESGPGQEYWEYCDVWLELISLQRSLSTHRHEGTVSFMQGMMGQIRGVRGTDIMVIGELGEQGGLGMWIETMVCFDGTQLFSTFPML